MEMRVSCCLFSTCTPVLHRICFGADLTRRKRRARRSNTLPRQLTRLLRAARQLLFGFTWSIQRPRPSCRSATKRIEPFGRTRTGALAHDIGYSRKLPLQIGSLPRRDFGANQLKTISQSSCFNGFLRNALDPVLSAPVCLTRKREGATANPTRPPRA